MRTYYETRNVGSLARQLILTSLSPLTSLSVNKFYLQVPDQASSILAKDARPHLLKLGDLAQSPHQHGLSQFQTCSHCSGSVQNI